MFVLQPPALWGNPKPGLGLLALGIRECGREPLSLGGQCAGLAFHTPHLSPLFGTVEQPLDHDSLRQMVLSNYSMRVSKKDSRTTLHSDGISMKGDDLRSKKKMTLGSG